MRRVIAWMKKPDRAFGANAAEGRNRILAQALEEAVADLRKRFGDDMNAWKWGDIHTTDFVHPLGGTDGDEGAVPRRAGPPRRRRLHRHGGLEPDRDEHEADLGRVLHVRDGREQLGQLHRPQRAGQLGAAAQPALQGPDRRTGEKASISRWRSAARKSKK